MVNPRRDVLAKFQLRHDLVDVTTNWRISKTQFAKFSGIDIDMDNFSVRVKRYRACRLLGRLQTGANNNQQVTFEPLGYGFGARHTQHTQVRIVTFNGAAFL